MPKGEIKYNTSPKTTWLWVAISAHRLNLKSRVEKSLPFINPEIALSVATASKIKTA
jgi:hypothetical protein